VHKGIRHLEWSPFTPVYTEFSLKGLNWVLDRCQGFEDVDMNLTTASLQKLLGDVKSDLEHELSIQRREKGRRAGGREEALIFVTDYLASLMTATEIEAAKGPV